MKQFKKIAFTVFCSGILLWISVRIFHRQYPLYQLLSDCSAETKVEMLSRAKNMIRYQTFSSVDQPLLDSTILDLEYASFKMIQKEKFDWYLGSRNISSVGLLLRNEDLSITIMNPYLSEGGFDSLDDVRIAISLEETTLKTWYEHFWMNEFDYLNYMIKLLDKMSTYFGSTDVYAFDSLETETRGLVHIGSGERYEGENAMIMFGSKKFNKNVFMYLHFHSEKYDVRVTLEQIARTFKFNDFDQEDLPMYRQKLMTKCLPVDWDEPKNETH